MGKPFTPRQRLLPVRGVHVLRVVAAGTRAALGARRACGGGEVQVGSVGEASRREAAACQVCAPDVGMARSSVVPPVPRRPTQLSRMPALAYPRRVASPAAYERRGSGVPGGAHATRKGGTAQWCYAL